MTKVEVLEIFQKLKNHQDERYVDCYYLKSEYLERYQEEKTKVLDILNGYTVKNEESFGGEGKGDHAHKVYSFSKDGETLYLKLDGYYTSYDGTEWDDKPYVVEPYMKQVRDWAEVPKE